MSILPQRMLQIVDGRTSAPTADPLAALAKAGANGDTDALRTLILSVGPAILQSVRGVIGARHPDAEDVAQEAALGLARALPTFRFDCTVLHFTCRISVLTALTARRRMRVRAPSDLDCVEADTQGSDDASPARLAAAARRREILRTLCETLPKPQSEALTMLCILGLTVEEIAVVTGVPPNTVSSRLRQAKRALRSLVEADPLLVEALEIDE